MPKSCVVTDEILLLWRKFTKLIINVPLSYSREYLEDLDKNTFPNVGDDFEEKYYVRYKTIENDVCTLDLGR